ncbi:MAG: SURF1 family protein [Alphaproteobacteria bacterium]|nr:SURF1 family protein [Alphaproteobacteria bacterium]
MTSRFGFRPRLFPTLFTIPAVIMMLGLGTWQVQRLIWKTELIDQFEARVTSPAIAPPEITPDAFLATVEDWRYRHVEAEGRFLNDKELHLIGRTYKGNAGFHVLTPLVLDSGMTVFVNRGWVPQDRRRAPERPETLVEGETSVEGLIQQAGRKGYFVPENEPQNDIWFTVRPEAMAEFLGLEGPVAPYYIDELRPLDGKLRLPFGANREIEVRNEHLQYAITWYLLALTLIVVYVLWHRSMDKKEPEA